MTFEVTSKVMHAIIMLVNHIFLASYSLLATSIDVDVGGHNWDWVVAHMIFRYTTLASSFNLSRITYLSYLVCHIISFSIYGISSC
jgi:hypothetical protein